MRIISQEPDTERVRLDSEAAVLYWTSRFNVSRDELEEAVDIVGNSISAVAAYLNIAG
ncbi:DUF3606 domain-containing protein [Sphingobium sp.]|uniref:DUF3606 domain-containing protein n=1 Tax=Sphingobium sp. TaxID=1912891 RepID=UPI003B3A5FC4